MSNQDAAPSEGASPEPGNLSVAADEAWRTWRAWEGASSQAEAAEFRSMHRRAMKDLLNAMQAPQASRESPAGREWWLKTTWSPRHGEYAYAISEKEPRNSQGEPIAKGYVHVREVVESPGAPAARLTVEQLKGALRKAAPGSQELLGQLRDHALQRPSETPMGGAGAPPQAQSVETTLHITPETPPELRAALEAAARGAYQAAAPQAHDLDEIESALLDAKAAVIKDADLALAALHRLRGAAPQAQAGKAS